MLSRIRDLAIFDIGLLTCMHAPIDEICTSRKIRYASRPTTVFAAVIAAYIRSVTESLALISSRYE